MPTLHPVVERVTARIAERSLRLRGDYLARMDAAREAGPARRELSCGNLAHGFAASGADKANLRGGSGGNIGIVTAYNDMLSAHQPMEQYPTLIRTAARNAGGTAQVAGGVPAMWAGERALQLKGGHCLQDPYRNLYASCVHMAVLASGALNLQGRVLDTEPFLQRGRQ